MNETARVRLTLTASPEVLARWLADTIARVQSNTEPPTAAVAEAIVRACRSPMWADNTAQIEIAHREASVAAKMLQEHAIARGLRCRIDNATPDKSRVLVTLRESGSGRMVQRELGVTSEFNSHGEYYRRRFIADWIADRANAQHGRPLELVEYRYLAPNHWRVFYGANPAGPRDEEFDREQLREHVAAHGLGEPTAVGYALAEQCYHQGDDYAPAASAVVSRDLLTRWPDVVDHVFQMQDKYDFVADVDGVREAVESSAELLGISLAEEEITAACQAVEEGNADPHRRRTAKADPGYRVAVGVIAKPGASTISDVRLAAGLGHVQPTSATDLLVAEVDGQVYVLRLAGTIAGHDGRTDEAFDAESITEAHLAELETGGAGGALETSEGPWFEWITAEGGAVGDIFDEISLDPDAEIERLKGTLAHSAPSISAANARP